jgi:hypothetical protein
MRVRIKHPANNPISKPKTVPVDAGLVVALIRIPVFVVVLPPVVDVVKIVEFVLDLVAFAVELEFCAAVATVAVVEGAADITAVPPPALSQGDTTHCDASALSTYFPLTLVGVKLSRYVVERLPAPQTIRPIKTSELALMKVFWAQKSVKHFGWVSTKARNT